MFDAIKRLFRKEICPYCFGHFRFGEAPLRCTSPAKLCAPEKDEVWSKFTGDPKKVGRVLPPPGRLAQELRCPDCDQFTQQRICPQCHMDLPRDTGHVRNLIFSVIGGKEAGKSHYIAVLIQELLQRVGPDLGLLLEALDDTTRNRYRKTFYEPLYRKHSAIRGTVSALADAAVRTPLLYGLTFSERDRRGRRRIRGSVTLVFFDTAGEDMNSEDTLAVVNKYIYRSHGIILLVDPLQLPWVRDHLPPSTPLPARDSDETLDIVVRVTNLIRAGLKLRRRARIDIPLAVSFSKLDAVRPLIDSQLRINASPCHEGGFHHDDAQAVSGDMQSLLAAWQGNALIHQVQTRFTHHAFFGLSALGCNPHGDHRVPRVVPMRVEDPFLWLLHHHKLIPAVGR